MILINWDLQQNVILQNYPVQGSPPPQPIVHSFSFLFVNYFLINIYSPFLVFYPLMTFSAFAKLWLPTEPFDTTLWLVDGAVMAS